MTTPRRRVVFWTLYVTFVLVLFVIPVTFSLVGRHHEDVPVMTITSYTGDHGVSYRIFTVVTQEGIIANITVTCTFYDHARTLPIVDAGGWYWGYTWNSYLIDPPNIVQGC